MTQDPPGLHLDGLRHWLTTTVPTFGSEFTYQLLAGGRSNVSYRLTDTAGRSIVVRRPPLGHVMPSAHDMSREYKVMTGLHSVGFPTPKALGLCTDDSVIGANFMVMDFVTGRTIDTEQVAVLLSATEADMMSCSLVDTLAQLHRIEPSAAGLGDLGKPIGFLSRQVKRWGQQWELSQTRELHDIDRLRNWLASRVDDIVHQTNGCVIHGDFRIDNVIVDSQSAQIRAVVDWEMATLGDPLTDLAILLVYWTSSTDTLRAAVPVAQHITDGPGFWTREDIVEHYARTSGLDVDQLDVYVALACLKLAAIMESIHKRNLAGLQLGTAGGHDNAMGKAAEALARLGVGTMEHGALAALNS